MTKIAVFAVPFSPNLGDGVIFECLRFGIEKGLPDAEVIPVDLAGRKAYGEVSIQNRRLVLRLLPRLPQQARHAIVSVVLGRRLARLRSEWTELLKDCDAAIIGGGQLFADADLNFPLKINAVADIAVQARRPLAVFSVGAAGTWSARGAQLFGHLTATDLRFLSGRDTFSTEALKAALRPKEGTALATTPDPGLLASLRFPYDARRKGIAICVAAEELLSYHADRPMTAGARGVGNLLAETALAFVERGQTVRFFTNGAEEDEAALDSLLERKDLAELVSQSQVIRLPRARTPEDLCQAIAGSEGVVAHRLHACILAYSYRVPVLGLAWDRKVESFFDSIGHADLLVGESNAQPEAIASRLVAAMDRGLDVTAHSKHVEGAQRAIGDMVSRLLA